MNFQSWSLLPPVRVMMINPLARAAKMATVKFLSGNVFGLDRLIDVILLVFSNEIPEANAFIQELYACSFGCLNTIVATSDLPSITDADVFCCMTNFTNPNVLDFDDLDNDDQFDTFYLYIKVALSLKKTVMEMREEETKLDKNKPKIEKKEKPLFIGDGLVILDILNSFGAEGMATGFFCAGCVPALARSTLAEYLQVRCTDINRTYVWGTVGNHFHIEIEKPYIKTDKISVASHCDWEMVSKDVLNPLKLDISQFNASWMKKEFVEKLREMASKNPTGPIYRAWKMNRFLTKAWLPRISKQKVYVSVGIISDGSLRTIKGIPYILPVVLNVDGSWEINYRFENDPHVIQEIKKINKVASAHHEKLIKYCNKFLQENIIDQAFVPMEEESEDTRNTSYSGTQDHIANN